MKSNSFLKNNWFLISMLVGIVAGCIVGWLWPVVTVDGEVVSAGATVLEPLGTVFINLMFCVVVPMVFCSIASAIANMGDMRRAGKVLGTTVATFLVTAAIASVIMYVVVRVFPLVTGSYEITEGEVGTGLGLADMIINFFTKPDFIELWSRRAILPLIVAAVIFGFGVQLAGGPETATAKLLADLSNCIMKTVKIITYYAPIGFFGFFAYLVATYGPQLIGDYSRTLVIYYVMSFLYLAVFSPIYASAAARAQPRSCSSICSNPQPSPSAPAPPWPPSPPIWKWLRTPASPRTSPTSCCPWAPPCTWTAPPCWPS